VTSRFSRALAPAMLLFVLGVSTSVFAQATTNQLNIQVTYPTPAPGSPKLQSLPDTFSAQSHPAPTPTPLPAHLSVSGKVRGYSFDRLNRVQNAANPDRHANEFGALLHLDYRLGDSPVSIGYTYSGAYDFGLNGPKAISNPHIDNTLPGFPLNSPIHEAYVQYRDGSTYLSLGDQVLNLPWAPNSDSRLQPASYQGFDSTFKIEDALSFSLTRIIRFEPRNSSNFNANTLLTAAYPGTTLDKFEAFTPGALRAGLNFHPSPRFDFSADTYEFYNIADLEYGEAKYGLDPYSTVNPYVAAQYVQEDAAGTRDLGRINNHTVGLQLGANVLKGLLFTVSADDSPWQYATVHAATAGAATSGFFVGSGGSGTSVKLAPGVFKVAYGGIASPYTDSYATDPLYTTQISQGTVDRRSAAASEKIALVYTPPNKQWKLLADEAWYNYSNIIAHNVVSEFNLDGTYYLNKVRQGPYKGLFLRVRIAPRQQPILPFGFEYQRFQAEYDF